MFDALGGEAYTAAGVGLVGPHAYHTRGLDTITKDIDRPDRHFTLIQSLLSLPC